MHKKEHFLSLLSKFNQGMLVTHAADGELHARPMAIAQVDDDVNLWLVSDVNSGKIAEIQQDARASITLQDGARYLSINGTCEVLRDAALVEKLWNEHWRVWFPDGPRDPDIVLLKLKTVQGEYWDNSGASGIKYLYESAKAYMTGDTPHTTEENQGKVALQH